MNVTSITRRPASRGFSLIELLVVLGIIAILAALIAPATFSLIRSSNLNRAASMVSDEMDVARQQALTKNRDVEIHFYKVGSKSTPTNLQFRAFRSFSTTGTSATLVPVSKIKYLPEPIILSTALDKSGKNVSTLLDTTITGRSTATATEILPGGTTQTTYVAFKFRANGGTDLSVTPTDPWDLTLYAENGPVNATTGIPANYFTLQLDPVTGRVKSYRP